jgi:hypothetical protein
MLEPAEERVYELELTALRGPDELGAFEARIQALGPAPA